MNFYLKTFMTLHLKSGEGPLPGQMCRCYKYITTIFIKKCATEVITCNMGHFSSGVKRSLYEVEVSGRVRECHWDS